MSDFTNSPLGVALDSHILIGIVMTIMCLSALRYQAKDISFGKPGITKSEIVARLLRGLTTKVLIIFFGALLAISFALAVVFRPDGMWGNIVAELIGLSLAALTIELLLVARDEQLKNDFEWKQNHAVSLNITQNVEEERTLRIFLNQYIATKIKDPSLYLRFKNESGESTVLVASNQGEFSAIDLALKPLVSEAVLADQISKCNKMPDELVVKWIDQQNIDRECPWPIERFQTVLQLLKDNPDISSASL